MQLWLNDPHNVEKLRAMKKLEKKGSASYSATRLICWFHASELDVSAFSFSLSEEAVRAPEHQLRQRLPQHSL